jgi:hypothetical protein
VKLDKVQWKDGGSEFQVHVDGCLCLTVRIALAVVVVDCRVVSVLYTYEIVPNCTNLHRRVEASQVVISL